MPLIIDGNNLLHASKPAALAGLDELGLCRALAHTPWRSEGVTIVCDGEPGVLGRLESPVPEVELRYAGRNRSADAVIEQLVNASTAPRRLTVVSSDRAVRRAAERRRARTWTSERFARELAATLARRRSRTPDPGSAPEARVPEGEVRRWLETFGFDPDELESDAGGEPRSEDPDDISRHWPPW